MERKRNKVMNKKIKVELVMILTKKVELDMSDYRPRCGADMNDLGCYDFEESEIEAAAKAQRLIPNVDGWEEAEIQVEDV